MRCPKCGYTSFDNLEHCKRCKKNIAATATALMGTVLDTVAPSYLQGYESAQEPEELTGASSAVIADNNEDLRLSESPDFPAASDEPATDMDLNLSNVDISDLKEPATESPVQDEDFSLENLQTDDMGLNKPVAAPAEAPAKPGAAKTGTALDDFNVELDELLEEEKA